MPAWEQEKPARPHKGKYRPGFPLDYVVVDTETTGLDRYSCVIEAAALRVRGGQVTAEFSTLIQPPRRELYRNGEWQEGFVEPFITQLTGITDSMLETAPLPETALPQLLDFLGDDPILGHNVHFDVNMLYDDLTRCLGRPLQNDYFDTLRLSRKLLPQLPRLCFQKLSSLVQFCRPRQFFVSPRACKDLRMMLLCKLLFLFLRFPETAFPVLQFSPKLPDPLQLSLQILRRRISHLPDPVLDSLLLPDILAAESLIAFLPGFQFFILPAALPLQLFLHCQHGRLPAVCIRPLSAEGGPAPGCP